MPQNAKNNTPDIVEVDVLLSDQQKQAISNRLFTKRHKEKIDLESFDLALDQLKKRKYRSALKTLKKIPAREQDAIVKAAIAICHIKLMNKSDVHSSWFNSLRSLLDKTYVPQTFRIIRDTFYVGEDPYLSSFLSRTRYSNYLKENRYHKIQHQFGLITKSIINTTKKSYPYVYPFAPLVGITVGSCHGLFKTITRDALGISEQIECVRRLELVNELENNRKAQDSRLKANQYWAALAKPPTPPTTVEPLLSKKALIDKIFARYQKYFINMTASRSSKDLFAILNPACKLQSDDKWEHVSQYMRDQKNNGKKLFLIIYEILKNEKRLDLPEPIQQLLTWRS